MTNALRRWLDVPWTRWLERAALVALLAIAAPRFLPQFAAFTGVSEVDGPAPSFAAARLDGSVVTSDELRGSVVVINVWATWCPPCRVEMPALQRLWEVQGDNGLVVLGVNADVGNADGVRAFVEERDLTFPIVRLDAELERALGGVVGYPTTLILGRDGRVRHRMVGYVASPVLHAAVERLLEEEAPRPLSAGTASFR